MSAHLVDRNANMASPLDAKIFGFAICEAAFETFAFPQKRLLEAF